MGKGDQRTKRGKIKAGSYGNNRPKRKNKNTGVSGAGKTRKAKR